MTKFTQALLVLAAMSPLLCGAKLVIFGDSISDNGIDGILAGTELVNNRFSTGPVSLPESSCLPSIYQPSDGRIYQLLQAKAAFLDHKSMFCFALSD